MDHDRIGRRAGIRPGQRDNGRVCIAAGVDVNPVAGHEGMLLQNVGEGGRRGTGGKAQIGVIADGRTIHVAIGRGIVHIVQIGAVFVAETGWGLAIDVCVGLQFHFPLGVERGRVVGRGVLAPDRAIGGGHVVRQYFPVDAVVAREPDGHRGPGVELAAVPAQPRTRRRVQLAAIHEAQRLQPGVGLRLAGLAGAAMLVRIEAAAVGFRFAGPIRGPGIAQIDGGAEAQGGIGDPDAVRNAAGGAGQVEIPPGGIDELWIRVQTVRPAQATVLEGRKRGIAPAHPGVPDQVVFTADRLPAAAEQCRGITQNAVGNPEGVVRRSLDEGGRLLAPHYPVLPPVGGGSAVEITVVVLRRHAPIEQMAGTAHIDAILVGGKEHVAQRDIRGPVAIEAVVAARQLEVFELEVGGPAHLQRVLAPAVPLEERARRTADDPDRLAGHAGIEPGNDGGGQGGGDIPRVHVDDILALEVIGIQHRLEAALGTAGRCAQVVVIADGRTVHVVVGAVIVHVEGERGIRRHAYAEGPGIGGRGPARVGIHHPPQYSRVLLREGGLPNVGFVRGVYARGDVAPGRAVVRAELQVHLPGRCEIGAGHPLQPPGLDQVAAVVERQRKQPRVGAALAGLRRAPIEPEIDPAAVGLRLVGPNRAAGRAEIDRRAVGQRRVRHPDAVRDESGRTQHMEIQVGGIEEEGVGIGHTRPVGPRPLQIRHGIQVLPHGLAPEQAAGTGQRRQRLGNERLRPGDDAARDVAEHQGTHGQDDILGGRQDGILDRVAPLAAGGTLQGVSSGRKD